jgi:outer membrane murein-binding lipoprotein Lpp
VSTRSKIKGKLAAAVAAVLPLAGCITVRPPDKPIEVNLNVDIKQEVSVRLQQDVQQMIQKNPQAFPPPPTAKKK